MILNFLIQQGEYHSFGGQEPEDILQIEYNMKMTAVFAQCAIQVVQADKFSIECPIFGLKSSSNVT